MMNIDYDDVLHLYRGWRKSETALKDKNKELEILKDSVKHLQESHSKFRGQITALESVKELTINLQNQLAVMEQENKQLLAENRELAELNLQAEDLLREKTNAERKQAELLRDVQLDVANLQGRYDEAARIQVQMEAVAAEEQALRLGMETRMKEAQLEGETSKDEVKRVRSKLDAAMLRLGQCDQELAHASEQLNSLSREVSDISSTRNKLSSAESEIGILKGDISRLLRLLEHSPATRDFIAQWQSSDGMDFVGIARDMSGFAATSQHSGGSHDHSAGYAALLDIDGGSMYPDDDNIGTSRNLELTPVEFAHLKRVHGGDPFPMSTNMEVS